MKRLYCSPNRYQGLKKWGVLGCGEVDSRSTKNYLKKIKGNTGKNKLSQRLHLLKENQNLEFAPNEQVENIKTYNKLHFSTI